MCYKPVMRRTGLHLCRNREHCGHLLKEKGDARRYPQHTLAPDPQQDELKLEKPDEDHC